VAAFAWRLTVCIGLVIAAEALFAGAGVALAAVAVVLWLGFPLARFARYLVLGNRQEQPNRMRFALVSAAAAAGAILLFTCVPWPWRVSAPAVVRYAEPTIVRTETDGFVERIHVQPGDAVRAGQVLVTLHNRQLEIDRQDLELAITESGLKSRTYHRQGRVAACQAEEQTRLALEARAQQKQQELESLVVRAPAAGQIVQLDPEPLLGRYVPRGSALMVIANEEHKELALSIDQDDSRPFNDARGRLLSAYIPAWETTGLTCRLEQVEPRATTDILLPEQAAPHGGRLDVKPTRPAAGSTEPAWSHLTPQFSGRATLTAAQSRQLHAGQRGTVVLDEHPGTVGQVLTTYLRNWLRHRLAALR
jgi:putative peptide zinc metalloprotease protein